MRPSWSPRPTLVLALLAAAACSGSSDGSGGDASPDASRPPRAVIDVPGASTTAPRVTTTVASRFAFVDYQTAAGNPRVSRTLKVWPDGRATCTKANDRTDFTVSAATVTELRSALEAANLAALPPVSGTQTPEAAVSRVIFGGQAVRYFGGSMPPELGPAVTILDRLLARGCP